MREDKAHMSTVELTAPGRGRGRRTKLAPYTRQQLDSRSVAAPCFPQRRGADKQRS
jgi:hypothetical protein